MQHAYGCKVSLRGSPLTATTSVGRAACCLRCVNPDCCIRAETIMPRNRAPAPLQLPHSWALKASITPTECWHLIAQCYGTLGTTVRNLCLLQPTSRHLAPPARDQLCIRQFLRLPACTSHPIPSKVSVLLPVRHRLLDLAAEPPPQPWDMTDGKHLQTQCTLRHEA